MLCLTTTEKTDSPGLSGVAMMFVCLFILFIWVRTKGSLSYSLSHTHSLTHSLGFLFELERGGFGLVGWFITLTQSGKRGAKERCFA